MATLHEVRESIAAAIYEIDEDILDEAILKRQAESSSLLWGNEPRQPWAEMSTQIKDAYRRRAAAALASLAQIVEPGHTVILTVGKQSMSITRLGAA